MNMEPGMQSHRNLPLRATGATPAWRCRPELFEAIRPTEAPPSGAPRASLRGARVKKE